MEKPLPYYYLRISKVFIKSNQVLTFFVNYFDDMLLLFLSLYQQII